MIVFGPFCMAHSLVVAGKMLRAAHEGREPELVACIFSEERADALLKPMAGCAPRPQQRILVLAVEIKPPRECSQSLELISSVVAAVAANYKPYI